MSMTAILVVLAIALSAFFAYRTTRDAMMYWSEGRAYIARDDSVYAFRAGLVAPRDKSAYYVAGLRKKGYPLQTFRLGQAAQALPTLPPETASHEDVVTAAVQGIGYDLAMSLPLDCFRVAPRGREVIVYTTEAGRLYTELCRGRVRQSATWAAFWLGTTVLLLTYAVVGRLAA